MSETKYIELDSSYRNRMLYRNPSSFQISVQSGESVTALTALDPVSDALPIKKWYTEKFKVNVGLYNYIECKIWDASAPGYIPYLGEASDGTTISVSSKDQNLLQISGYYNGAVIVNTSVSPNEYRRIVEYTLDINDEQLYSGDLRQHATIIIDKPFSSSIAVGNNIEIRDPTDLSDLNTPIFFVPNGSALDNAYSGYLLFSDFSGYSRPILSYDGTTRLAILDTSQSLVNTSISGPIIASNWKGNAGDSQQLMIIKSRPTYSGGIASSTTNTIVLNPNPGGVDNLYVGSFLYVRPLASGYSLGEYKPIIGWNSTTSTITINPVWLNTPIAGDVAQICNFTRDNANPIVYQNSLRGKEIYEIELLNLIIPNKTLEVAGGSRIVNYPYVYVRLLNEGISSGGPRPIFSNNPNSTNMLFKVPCDDVPPQSKSAFVKIDGDGMVQTVSFDPSRALTFKIGMSNGDSFKTFDNDTESGTSPDPSVQISACFALRKKEIKRRKPITYEKSTPNNNEGKDNGNIDPVLTNNRPVKQVELSQFGYGL